MNTRIALEQQLNELRHKILEMAARVEENLSKALCALRTRNIDLASAARANDSAVDALQIVIEDETAIIIATQQPVARDLRELVTIYKLTRNIERIGDYAVHLAKAAKKLSKKEVPNLRAQEHLERMVETGQEMLRKAISAYMEQNIAMAREAAAMDSKINIEHKELTEDVLKLMKKHPDTVKAAVQIMNTSNQMERLGDHITNICESVIYMVEGKHEDLNG
jgi:phosphate transport system protein